MPKLCHDVSSLSVITNSTATTGDDCDEGDAHRGIATDLLVELESHRVGRHLGAGSSAPKLEVRGAALSQSPAGVLAGRPQPTPRAAYRKCAEYANELGLFPPQAQADNLKRSGASGLQWQVEICRLSRLPGLPRWHPHAGSTFDWIGSENTGIPRYLWDSKLMQTVDATPTLLQEHGYIAVSWTWGRFQLRDSAGQPIWRSTHGVKWRVPKLRAINGVHGVKHLKHILQDIGNNTGYQYFWVDVLCIDQGSGKDEEMQTEIAKQANIFARANGVFAYLWSLDEMCLAKALASFGGLLSWAVTFGSTTNTQSQFIIDAIGRKIPGPLWKDYEMYNNFLQEDQWFTSLWALQEIILAPSAIWITRSGTYCLVNGDYLTTRFFAMAVRFLSMAMIWHDKQWSKAEERFMMRMKMDDEAFRDLKERFEADKHNDSTQIQKSLAEQRRDRSGPEVLVIEALHHDEEEPGIIKCRRAERQWRSLVSKWKAWAFGKACIDVSLSASRSAILLAGKNRHVVEHRSRETALLAALKIGHHTDFIHKDSGACKSRHFSTNLLNVILHAEGVKMFDVMHGTLHDLSVDMSTAVDLSEWETNPEIPYLLLRDVGTAEPKDIWTEIRSITGSVAASVAYRRNGRLAYTTPLFGAESLLTNASPCSAASLNVQLSHFLDRDDIAWVSSDGWHVHDRGSVHVPPTARVQILKKRARKKFWFRPNESQEDYPLETAGDEKVLLKHQPWLIEKLGSRPRFMFLQLGDRFLSVEPSEGRNTTSFVNIKRAETFGIVLVGHTKLKQDVSMTKWHKFGVYHGSGEDEALGWKDGIIITSYSDASVTNTPTTQTCQELQASANMLWRTLSDHRVYVEGFETVTHDEVLRVMSPPRDASRRMS